jgi:UDP-GlcNAc:undecaprenyl-phosphate GlcNAc-1-phosphate transferase
MGLAISTAVTPVIMGVARRLGFVAQPREDRWSTHFSPGRLPPTLMGGVGIYLTLAAGAALYLPWNRQWIGIAAGATLMFVVGLMDDFVELRPHLKVLAPVAAAMVLLATGTTVTLFPQPWLGGLLTVAWVVAITNAVNLLDNMDGLSSGVVLLSALTLAIHGISHGQPALATMALLIAGTCGGFLIYNFNPAKLFMGDCGSLLLGFLMSTGALLGTARVASDLILALFVPVMLLVVPVFDTTLVLIARWLHGRSIVLGGRDHSSHRLVALELSERATVGVLYAISAAFGLLALASARLSTAAMLVLAALMFGALALFGYFLGQVQVYGRAPDPLEALDSYERAGSGPRRIRQGVQLLLDVGLIVVALFAAYLLRFEASIPASLMERLTQGLPYLVAAKVVCLVAARSYRGSWQAAQVSDVLAVLKGSTAGSLLATGVLALTAGLEHFSRTALIIDWVVFTCLAVLSRTGLVLLDHLFRQRPSRDARRVIVVDVDGADLAVVRQLLQPRGGSPPRAASSLDDDETAYSEEMEGLPAVATLADLPAVVRRLDADAIVIALGGQPTRKDGAGLKVRGSG